MQTLTKNPLASPGILGINAGAGFAVVFAMIFSTFQACNLLRGLHFLVRQSSLSVMELVSQVEMLLLQ